MIADIAWLLLQQIHTEQRSHSSTLQFRQVLWVFLDLIEVYSLHGTSSMPQASWTLWPTGCDPTGGSTTCGGCSGSRLGGESGYGWATRSGIWPAHPGHSLSLVVKLWECFDVFCCVCFESMVNGVGGSRRFLFNHVSRVESNAWWASPTPFKSTRFAKLSAGFGRGELFDWNAWRSNGVR